MATKFSEVYEQAIYYFKDKDFLSMHDWQKEDILRVYLRSAQADFYNCCKNDIQTTNEEERRFEVDLNLDEMQVLALGVAYYWLTACAANKELLVNHMSTKDFSYHSNAQLLSAITEFRNTIERMYKHKIISYTYVHGNLEAPSLEV